MGRQLLPFCGFNFRWHVRSSHYASYNYAYFTSLIFIVSRLSVRNWTPRKFPALRYQEHAWCSYAPDGTHKAVCLEVWRSIKCHLLQWCWRFLSTIYREICIGKSQIIQKYGSIWATWCNYSNPHNFQVVYVPFSDLSLYTALLAFCDLWSIIYMYAMGA